MTTIRIATDAQRLQKQDIEGPTRKQALGMAARRRQLLADAAAASDQDKAFDWDCVTRVTSEAKTL